MDRFTLDFPTYGRLDLDEDGRAELPEPEAFHCFGCGDFCASQDLGMEMEPDCTCIRTGDMDDASYCDAHGPRGAASWKLCKTCAAPEPETVELAEQDTAETLALLARSGCSRSEAAQWMKVIEERVA